MASYRISSIEKFDFGKPEEWPTWIRRYERFRVASGLESKGQEAQISTLIYSMGDKAEDLLQSFQLTEAQAKEYETVVSRFKEYFDKRRNTIYERAKFNRRVQREGETVDEFITDLYRLARYCQYGALHDELVRDRIVVGIRDSKLSEKLQLMPKLTLEEAVTQARQSETVKTQQEVVRGETAAETTIEPVRARTNARRQDARQKPQARHTPRHKPQRCTRCGKTPSHNRDQCPARDATCHKCNKKGHYKQCCKTRVVIPEVTQSDSEDEVFLGAVSTTINKPWVASVQVNRRVVEFKVDTGADVTVIPESEYQPERDGPLEKSDKKLLGPAREKLEVQGRFKAHLERKGVKHQQDVYVVRGLGRPLLGRPAIEALQVVSLVEPVSEGNLRSKFPKLFKGLGKLRGDYSIKLQQDAVPYALNTPRRVPIPLLPKVKAELQRMESLGVITKISEPTQWCAGMVVVPKPNGKVRICVDLTKLNENVQRERHILPSVEQTLAQIGDAKYFSRLDANSGFWQIGLDEESSKLTTFITPFGRFRFNRLPFGITSAPEHFQRRMTEILGDIKGVVCLVDDVLVSGKTREEHDQRLMAVLTRIETAGLTLGWDKCEFYKTSVKFLGQLVNETGIKTDPEKVRAIQEMDPPKNVSELRRFLGMINQQSKFTPHLAEHTQPLRELLSKKNQWTWGHAQQNAFDNLKKAMTTSETLARYDPQHDTILSADASSYGVGAVLRQRQPDGKLKPIAYASRALTETEKRYAQIEKEALATTWACERFQDYLIGTTFKVETDHKPLVPLLSTKPLDSVPLRVQRFRLRLMRFHYSIVHVPGSELHTADTLSRAPINGNCKDEEFRKEVKAYVDAAIQSFPATKQGLDTIRDQQERDQVCGKLKTLCEQGKLTWDELKGPLKPYYPVRHELNVVNGLLLRGSRIIVPAAIQSSVLEKLHSAHQGVTKCRQRAKISVWWPGVKKEIEKTVYQCPICCKHRLQHAEPLIPTPLPDYPWQRVATDLFEWNSSDYLLVVDYYSRYVEVAKLGNNKTSGTVISHLKSIFGRHGIPETVVSDNGPQYSSEKFELFAREYGFQHVTSSPKYPQANGAAERAVKTVKRMLEKNSDPYLAMLAIRSTPLANGYTPSELLMGRKLRTTLPMTQEQLSPSVPDLKEVREKEERLKTRMKENHDKRHRTVELPPLQQGDNVWVPEYRRTGIVVEQANTRSYSVQIPEGSVVRRNRRDLFLMPSNEQNKESSQTETQTQGESSGETSTQVATDSSVKTRSGRVSKPPDRLYVVIND